jgi:hypothetical protein
MAMTMKRKARVTRWRKRGVTTVEMILGVAAIMGCFVYPLSLAMRSTGKRIAQESDKGYDAMLNQAR